MQSRRFSQSWRLISFAACCFAVLASVSFSLLFARPVSLAESPTRNQQQNLAGQLIDPAKVIGRDNCKTCHDQEHAAWEASSHGSRAWQLLEHAKAPDFAAALGIAPDQITSPNSVCTQCHGTQMVSQGRLTVVGGNSCESCHGAAGGDSGWYRIHGDYGNGMDSSLNELLAQRIAESNQHREQRMADCQAAGMNRAGDVLAVAKNCLTCHIVPIEELLAAGHPTSSGFEFVRWSQGEVRHNFLLNRNENNEAPSLWLAQSNDRTAAGRDKLMFVAGKLADLELSLRIRAQVTSTERGSLGREVADRIDDAVSTLTELDVPELSGLAEVAQNYQLARRALRELTADDANKYSAAADSVGKIAAAFVATHPHGDNLPDSIRISPRVMGKVYQPGN